MVIVGMWLEHLLLLGPALNHAAAEVPLGVTDGLVFIGSLGLMVLAVACTLKTFPELSAPGKARKRAESVHIGKGRNMSRAKSKPPYSITLGSILFTVAFLYFYYVQPEEIGPEQPIPFSHNVHAGIKEIQCQFCHPYVAYSNFPGIPPVEKCLYCHNYIIVKFPWIQKEHDYFNTRHARPPGSR